MTRAHLASPGTSLDELLTCHDAPEQRSWRSFQISFVLLCVAGLTDPRNRDAHRDEVGQAQLLFFPTGGGKTEAYLGQIAFTLAPRRLPGVVGEGAGACDGATALPS